MKMELTDLKKRYGDEYPASVIVNGIRMGLRRDSQFLRSYESADRKSGCDISRFLDGSASITAIELQNDWSNWNDTEQLDFCYSCSWLNGQSDFPEMLRFIMQHGEAEHWSAIALDVASELARDEAFAVLVGVLRGMNLDETCNIIQGIAHTKHPNAENTLRDHLLKLWAHPTLWENADFINWIGYGATTCITHLIELGAPPSDFTEYVRRLSEHLCSRNRDSCRNFLLKYYSWLAGATE